MEQQGHSNDCKLLILGSSGGKLCGGVAGGKLSKTVVANTCHVVKQDKCMSHVIPISLTPSAIPHIAIPDMLLHHASIM